MKRITIEPVTRLEGHAKIEIFLDDAGNVASTYLQVPELRGFEQFCKGRRAEEMPQLTSRICGVCPVAHHFASTKALDMAFRVKPTPAAEKLRELLFCGYFIYDHILHFYYLAAPDFVVGPDAPAAERNILGVINKVGLDIAKEVIKHRAYGQKIIQIIGGKATHPVCGLPGGMSKPITGEERDEIRKMIESSLEFVKFTIKIFNDIVLANKDYVSLITGGAYYLPTYYMGMVDKNNNLALYDGDVRVVTPDGKEFAKFSAAKYADYLEIVEEAVEPQTYVKLPYLKKLGRENGMYRVGPLARLNAADSITTPLANEEYKRLFGLFGKKPVHNTLAYHWARLVELLYACERGLELVSDSEITSEDIRNNPVQGAETGDGTGIIEAARGTLIHHYTVSRDGLIEKLNLIVPTTANSPAINSSINKTAAALIKNGVVNDALLNMVEMSFRAYDPCFGCATHFLLGGRRSVSINIYDAKGNLLKKI